MEEEPPTNSKSSNACHDPPSRRPDEQEFRSISSYNEAPYSYCAPDIKGLIEERGSSASSASTASNREVASAELENTLQYDNDGPLMSTLQLAASFEAIDDALKSTKTASIKEATGPTRYAAYSGTGNQKICRKRDKKRFKRKNHHHH